MILLALPIAIKESKWVLNIFRMALQRCPYLITKCKILIKLHPDLEFEYLKNEFEDLFRIAEVVNSPIGELIIKSRLVITVGSTVCYESIILGVPVIIVESQNGLIQNPISNMMNRDLWHLVYKCEELINFIEYFLGLSDEEYSRISKLGKSIKDDYFEPITKKKIEEMLSITP